MIEVVNLSKTYMPKNGVNVLALDSVSLKFPEKGMIFIIGKSGSGKSTLLHLLGGLDDYDAGDIIVNNSSTSCFKQSEFDSYRNTYVGFVFQEYNIISDFTVGANIALAIELQGKKATDEEINNILTSVDLAGYGSRRPNELSGGQKQRVAIARALIKNPEIILADEPSGALDSENSKQVFDTLKKLSEDKLVIVVSHERDFAEAYGDRIIELADGKVINDYEKSNEVCEQTASVEFADGVAKVAENYQLTSEDLENIKNYFEEIKAPIKIENTKKKAFNGFKKTDNSSISKTQKPFEPIKSKIPFKTAFKMGASNLKLKPVRLVFTLLLSLISFVMFGLSVTFATFNKNETTINSIYDSKISYASFQKQQNANLMGDILSFVQKMDDSDLAKIEKDTGLKVSGVYCGSESSLSLKNNYVADSSISLINKVFYSSFSGFSAIDKETLDKYGFTLKGEMPTAIDEVAIPAFMAEVFKIYGYRTDRTQSAQTIKSANDMIGKTLTFSYEGNVEKTFKITGVFYTNDDFSRYYYKEVSSANQEVQAIQQLVNSTEFEYLMNYSFNSVLLTSKNFINSEIAKSIGFYEVSNDMSFANMSSGMSSTQIFLYEATESGSMTYDTISSYNYITTEGKIRNNTTWLKENHWLNDDEVLVSKAIYDALSPNVNQSCIISIPNVDENGKFVTDSVLGMPEYISMTAKIVGYFTCDYANCIAFDDDVIEESKITNIKKINNMPYSTAIGVMPHSKAEIAKLVNYSSQSTDGNSYALTNHITYNVALVSIVIGIFKVVFICVGVFNGIFAMILFGNFIAVGISNKKKEIGILRAIGASGADVFKIFFTESCLLALINFVLSFTFTGLLVGAINRGMQNSFSILASIFSFGFPQFISLLLISFGVAFVASIIPIAKIAKKKPIDAIKD